MATGADNIDADILTGDLRQESPVSQFGRHLWQKPFLNRPPFSRQRFGNRTADPSNVMNKPIVATLLALGNSAANQAIPSAVLHREACV